MKNTITDVVTSVTINFQAPEELLKAYRAIVTGARPRSLVDTANRLMAKVVNLQERLRVMAETGSRSIAGWLRKRRQLEAGKRNLEEAQQKLASWINSTITYFAARKTRSIKKTEKSYGRKFDR